MVKAGDLVPVLAKVIEVNDGGKGDLALIEVGAITGWIGKNYILRGLAKIPEEEIFITSLTHEYEACFPDRAHAYEAADLGG